MVIIDGHEFLYWRPAQFRLSRTRACERHAAMMDSMMTFPAERQKVILGIMPSPGPELEVMNLEMPVAATELAGEFVPPQDIDHDLLAAPEVPEMIRALKCPVFFHAGALADWSSPIPAR